jgi:hypothetical protein
MRRKREENLIKVKKELEKTRYEDIIEAKSSQIIKKDSSI